MKLKGQDFRTLKHSYLKAAGKTIEDLPPVVGFLTDELDGFTLQKDILIGLIEKGQTKVIKEVIKQGFNLFDTNYTTVFYFFEVTGAKVEGNEEDFKEKIAKHNGIPPEMQQDFIITYEETLTQITQQVIPIEYNTDNTRKILYSERNEQVLIKGTPEYDKACEQNLCGFM